MNWFSTKRTVSCPFKPAEHAVPMKNVPERVAIEAKNLALRGKGFEANCTVVGDFYLYSGILLLSAKSSPLLQVFGMVPLENGLVSHFQNAESTFIFVIKVSSMHPSVFHRFINIDSVHHLLSFGTYIPVI